MDSLFGMEFSLPMKFFIAFAVVLILIGTAAYLLRRFGTGGLAVTSQRNRQPRLAVVDNTPIDARRRLVIVRRDNVEHLLLIGGPTDVLVEANIVRAQSARDTAVRNSAAEPLTLPEEEPRLPAVAAPVPPQRPPVFIPVTHAPPVQPHPQAHLQAQPPHPGQYAPQPQMPQAPALQAPVPPAPPQLRAVAPPPMGVPQPPMPRPMMAPVLAPVPNPAPIPPPAPVAIPAAPATETPAAPSARPPQDYVQAVAAAMSLEAVPRAPANEETNEETPAEAPAEEEQNLADMAHRLEAALRQPSPPATAAPQAATPVQRPRPIPVAAAVPAPQAPRAPAPSYENLQREMANLLGRQSGSS